ncbi:Mu-like prophage I protein [Amphritea atlantica]|uniref:Mu-like prophage I protein n=1 Tax=Amphritea atlantica TaxID=355243 RepID=A0A1H9EG99_9GAMM|nr:phage protease [Amphritea atlantica]SEQ24602.1 Mu-like prophage I protein [Amphritea atlantica]
MKTNQSPHSIAVLSATSNANLGVVALSFELNDTDAGWCQLLPAGEFSAVDGRPFDVPGGKWNLTADIAHRLISIAKAAVNDLVIDYEHQTLNADKNGQPAPASGWFREHMEWREGSGLWIKPTWTSRALEYIKGKEYRFLSSVFPYDKRTGEPLFIHSAALTNRAGIDGMQDLEALCAQIVPHPTHDNQPQENPVMNKAMRKLLAQLGIELNEGDQLTDEQSTAALSALGALAKKAAKSEELTTEVAALKAKDGDIDLSMYVPAATYNALVTQMAVLKAGSDEASLEQLLKDAKAEGKVLAAEEDYLTKFGEQQGVAALKAMLDSRPSLVALKAQQTQGKKPEGEKADDLTAEDLAVLSTTGLDKAAFLKSKQELSQ